MEKPGGESGKRKVMVAIDESEFSHYALEWALKNLGESFLNSEVLIFTAQPVSDLSYLYASAYGAVPIELVTAVQDNHKKVAEALLKEGEKICSGYGITAKGITEVGDPKDTICTAVEKHNIQLLVIGSHGRNVLQRAFLGSVSNYCVNNAKCPVLVVRK